MEPGSGVTASGPPEDPDDPVGMYIGGGINHHHPAFLGELTTGDAVSGAGFAVEIVGGVGTGSLRGMAPSSSSGRGSNGELGPSGTRATRFPQRVRAAIVPSEMSVSPGVNETFLRVQ
jgi:hypothetical protein